VDVSQDDRENAPATSGVSRRTLIGAAGALGIAAAGFAALPAAAATAASTRNFLGSNEDVFKDIRDGQKISGVRYPGVPGLRLPRLRPEARRPQG
jgi:hypothetical protein